MARRMLDLPLPISPTIIVNEPFLILRFICLRAWMYLDLPFQSLDKKSIPNAEFFNYSPSTSLLSYVQFCYNLLSLKDLFFFSLVPVLAQSLESVLGQSLESVLGQSFSAPKQKSPCSMVTALSSRCSQAGNCVLISLLSRYFSILLTDVNICMTSDMAVGRLYMGY